MRYSLFLFSVLTIVLVATNISWAQNDPFGPAPIGPDPFGATPVGAGTTQPFAASQLAPPAPSPQQPTAEPTGDVPTTGLDPSETAVASSEMVGNITRVTLYRDQALVTREITVSADDKSGSIAIPSLPEMLIADSVFAEGDDNIAIRGVRVTSRPTTESDRQEVREIQDKIAANLKDSARIQREIEITLENLTSLSRLTDFTASKTSDDLNRGVLDAETLVEVSRYLMDQRSKLMTEHLENETRLAELQSDASLLQRQLSELTASNTRNRYQAIVFIDAKGPGTVKLNYQVGGCGWSPQYAIHGSVGGDAFGIRYSALVQQLSGEQWDDVQLTLSTASPSVSATGPTLAPFRITSTEFGAAQVAQQFDQAPNQSLSERLQSIKKQQRSAESQSYGKQAASPEVQRDYALNNLAAEIQQLELDAEAKTAARLAEDADDDVATQVYVIGQPVSLQSRREQQLVQIADTMLPGELYHVAIPLLSSYAYREAEVNNTEPIGLLGGIASVYLDDRFVGRCELPTTASGQKLIIGFGADQQVRIRRELRDKKDVLQGGNRNLEFTYRLVIANFKDQPVQVRLFDRIPVANEARDVIVNVTETSKSISEDRLYERLLKAQGILRWDLEIPGGSHGESAYDVEYTYDLDFDKNQSLTIAGLVQQTGQDLYNRRAFGGGMGGMGGGMGGLMGGMPGPTTSNAYEGSSNVLPPMQAD